MAVSELEAETVSETDDVITDVAVGENEPVRDSDVEKVGEID